MNNELRGGLGYIFKSERAKGEGEGTRTGWVADSGATAGTTASATEPIYTTHTEF